MIFLITFALACTPYDEFKIMCKARCNFDKDRSHWVTRVPAGKHPEKLLCHCGNPVQMETNLVIPRNFTVRALTDSVDDE